MEDALVGRFGERAGGGRVGETRRAVRQMEDDRRQGSVARGGDRQGVEENRLGGTRILDEHRSVAESVMTDLRCVTVLCDLSNKD